MAPTRIETPRLQLRELDIEDAPFILELLNEPAFLNFIGDKGVRDMAGARDYIMHGPVASYRRFGFGLYAVTLRNGDTPIGICGLVKRDVLPDADLGFAFLTRFHALGYAAESARAVMHHAATVLKLNRVVAIVAFDNHKSIAVLEKVGLRFERTFALAPGGPSLRLFIPAT